MNRILFPLAIAKKIWENAIDIKSDDNDAKAYNNIGNLFSSLGKHDQATEVYNKAIKIKPSFGKAYSNILLNLNYKLNFDLELYLSIAKKFR